MLMVVVAQAARGHIAPAPSGDAQDYAEAPLPEIVSAVRTGRVMDARSARDVVACRFPGWLLV